jgi:hypothetical protein
MALYFRGWLENVAWRLLYDCNDMHEMAVFDCVAM